MSKNLEFDRRTLLKMSACVGAGLVLPSAGIAAPGSSGSILIRNATVLTMDLKLGTLNNADVLIRDGHIEQVGEGLTAIGAEVIDASGMILMPGLVDSHWHLWNSILRSSAPSDGRNFFETQVAASKKFTPEMSALGVRLGLAEAVNVGITTVNNWAHNLRNPEFAEAEIQVMIESGVGGRFWYGYDQSLAPTAMMDFADILLVKERLKSAAPGRLDLGLAIRGPERTEPDIWTAEFAFAKKHQLPISTHIAVTSQAQKKGAVQQLADRGLLDSSVQLVHATHISERDVASIAASGASVCLTPLTEMRVGYGLAPVNALHQANIPVSLGVDTLVLAGNANLFMVMQTLLNLGTGASQNEHALTAYDVLMWATQSGANAMGLGAVTGSITPGKRADMILIDGRRLGMMPIIDPVASVVQSATPADVDTVIANGRILKRSGQVLGIDFSKLSKSLEDAVAILSSPRMV